MTDLREIETAMAAAAARDDFEEAARLRNLLFTARAAGVDMIDASVAGLIRQQPGAMGIGSQVARPSRPPNWRPPTKPDPMTRGTSRRGKGRG